MKIGDEDDAPEVPEAANALAPGEDSEEAEGERYDEGGEEAPEVVEAAPEAPSEPHDPETVALARELGWKPREEWKGDTSGWVDLDRFMELPSTLRKVNTRLMREIGQTKAAAAQGLKAQRERMEAERAAEVERIKREMRAAVEVGDTEKWEKLEGERERLTAKPQEPSEPPVVSSFKAQNEWARDPVKWGAMVQAVDMGLRSGAVRSDDPAEQLAYAERAVREHYPHWFANQAPPPRPTVQRVDGGSPAAPSRSRAKGWNDIAADERRDLKTLIPSVFKDEADAAKAYWEENG